MLTKVSLLGADEASSNEEQLASACSDILRLRSVGQDHIPCIGFQLLESASNGRHFSVFHLQFCSHVHDFFYTSRFQENDPNCCSLYRYTSYMSWHGPGHLMKELHGYVPRSSQTHGIGFS